MTPDRVFTRWMLAKFPIIRWSGVLYHGSPRDGIIPITISPSPQTHHLGELLSVSTNDNIIQTYGQDDHQKDPGSYGVVWEIPRRKPLRILDDRQGGLQETLLTTILEIPDPRVAGPHIKELLHIGLLRPTQQGPQAHDWIPELAHANTDGIPDVNRLLSPYIHGIALPGFDDPAFTSRSENELALTSSGCNRLANRVEMIHYINDWLPTEEALEKLSA